MDINCNAYAPWAGELIMHAQNNPINLVENISIVIRMIERLLRSRSSRSIGRPLSVRWEFFGIGLRAGNGDSCFSRVYFLYRHETSTPPAIFILSLFRSIENHSTRKTFIISFFFLFFYSKEKTKLLGQVKKYLFDTINKNLYAYVQRLIVEKSYAIKGEGNRNRKSIIDWH